MPRPSNMLEWLAKPSGRTDEKRMTLQMASRVSVYGRLDWLPTAATGIGHCASWQDPKLFPGLIETDPLRRPVVTGRSPEVDAPWEVVGSSEMIVVSHKMSPISYPGGLRAHEHLNSEGLG